MPAHDGDSRDVGLSRERLRRHAGRSVDRGLVLVPGGLVVYLAFNAGGFFPKTQDAVDVLLAILLAGHVLLTRRGALRRNPPLLAVSLCFGAFAGWIALSILWSHAPLRATNELGLALVYLLTLLLFGRCATSPRRIRWLVRGLALGAFAVCLVALTSRVLPALWPIDAELQTARLSYPVTYWNALGLLAALGAILCLGLTGDDREPALLKALSALALPIFAATMLLTFSRGAIGAGLVGVLAYLVLARSRSLPGALLSVVPTSAIAFHVTYGANALAETPVDTPAAIAQGHHVALVVGLCAVGAALLRLLLVGLDRRLIALSWRTPISRRTGRASLGAALGLACALAIFAGLPNEVRTQYDRFVEGNQPKAVNQLRDRLTDPGADGRIDVWRVARRQFDSAPVHGTGAGTFVLAWNAQRPRFEPVVNAHSLYLENLGTLGLVGLTLLAVVLLAGVVALARRVRGPDRALWAAALAATLTWLIHAGVDWDWQVPAVSVPVFALVGAAFARCGPDLPGPSRRTVRALLAAGALALALVPVLDWISESHFQTSLTAFTGSNCKSAVSEAQASLGVLPFRPDAHLILAYCEMAARQGQAALRDVSSAVREDPNNWETRYGLAIVQGATGGDPRPEMDRALALNKYYAAIASAAGYFRDDARRYWVQDAERDLLQVDGSGDQTLIGLRPLRRTSSPILG